MRIITFPKIFIVLPLVILVSCFPGTPDIVPIHIDITPPPIDSTEPPPPPPPPPLVVKGPPSVYENCTLNKLTFDKTIPKFARHLYVGEKLDIDSIDPLPLFDLFSNARGDRKAFYLRAILNSYYLADGYYAEGLGSFGKQYLETKPTEFSSFWNDTSCFTDQDLETYANIVMLELSIASEDDSTDQLLSMYLKKIKTNCSRGQSPESGKQTLEKMYSLLSKKWKENESH